MNFNEYQKFARKTAIYPNVGNNLTYPVLGLNGETGEVSEKVKKLIRDKHGIVDDDFINTIIDELGDVLWYIAAIASELEVDLEVIAVNNIFKLTNRMQNNTVQGDGDNR